MSAGVTGAAVTGAAVASTAVVIVPVKPAGQAKSRLAAPGVDRAALARAIALDTIAAAAAVAMVVVVTSDADAAEAAASLGASIVADPGAGLDAAVAAGAEAAGCSVLRAALLGDLPALRPAELAGALAEAASAARAVVADAEGTGSTLITAAPGLAWRSAFGDGSLARHVALGCAPLNVPADSGLRRDVDTAEQLAEAAALGLGPRTAAVLGLKARLGA